MSAGALTEALLESVEDCLIATAATAAGVAAIAAAVVLIAAWALFCQRRQRTVPSNGREALAAPASRAVAGHPLLGMHVSAVAWNRGRNALERRE
jgi:hypothetical protein